MPVNHLPHCYYDDVCSQFIPFQCFSPPGEHPDIEGPVFITDSDERPWRLQGNSSSCCYKCNHRLCSVSNTCSSPIPLLSLPLHYTNTYRCTVGRRWCSYCQSALSRYYCATEYYQNLQISEQRLSLWDPQSLEHTTAYGTTKYNFQAWTYLQVLSDCRFVLKLC